MIELTDLVVQYTSKRGNSIAALDGVSLTVDGGEMVAVRGPSGCGKTTLLMVAGAMQRPTGGHVRIAGDEVYALSPGARAHLRASRIGFVFQMFHLVPYLNVIDNVMLAARSPEATRDRALELLDELGLGGRLTHKPSALSTGERQRVAVARAVLNRPAVLLADEPTGNLDPENAAAVFEALRRYRDEGAAVMVVTHGPTADDFADRTIRMSSGRIVTIPQPGAVAHA